MSYYDYKVSQDLAREDHPFYALIMAAMRKADDKNLMMLRMSFPKTFNELKERYNAPGGLLPGEDI